MELRIANLIDHTISEGPGARFALWVQGCHIRCPGCCNPEMFSDKGGTLWSVDDLETRILASKASNNIEGVTFLGGEPTMQAPALSLLAKRMKANGLTVMMFSGFVLEQLRARPEVVDLLDNVDMLVDGPYDRTQPEPPPPIGRRWIGSSNQVTHYLTSAYSPEDPQMNDANTIEIRVNKDGVVINGWPSASQLTRMVRRHNNV